MQPRGAKPALRRLNQAALRQELAAGDEALMEAVVAGCAMVAYADGWVTPEEQKRMTGLIRAFDPVAAFGVAEVMERFDALSTRFADDHDAGSAHALALVARLHGRRRECRLLVETCCAIAEADGGFDAEERAALIAICDRLEVDPKEHGLEIVR